MCWSLNFKSIETRLIDIAFHCLISYPAFCLFDFSKTKRALLNKQKNKEHGKNISKLYVHWNTVNNELLC